MHPSPMQSADDDLRAICEPLLSQLETCPALLPVIEPDILTRLLEASRAGRCSRVVIYRLDGRLKLARRMALARASRGFRHG